MPHIALQGALTALVTPFTADGKEVDRPALERLVEEQIEKGISGLVPCGTTGETPTLSDAEQTEVVRTTARIARGRVPVVAGTGANDTKKSIERSRAALEAGADAVMIVMPYYNKPSQAGMVAHVMAIAKAVEAPIVLYNIPGRTGVELSVESTLRIADACSNVVAMKDATGHLGHCMELLGRAGDRLIVLCGDDPLTVPMMSVGARGVISVTSNLLPAAVTKVTTAALSGDWDTARREHLRLLPVHRAMFCEPNPQPAKAVLAARGKMNATVRLPLVEASPEARKELLAVLEEYGAS